MRRSRGFTLPEVLIATSIAVLLGGVLLVIVGGSTRVVGEFQASEATAARSERVVGVAADRIRNADRIRVAGTDKIELQLQRGNACERHRYFFDIEADSNQRTLRHSAIAVKLPASGVCTDITEGSWGQVTWPTAFDGLSGLTAASQFIYRSPRGDILSDQDLANPGAGSTCELGEQAKYIPVGTVELVVEVANGDTNVQQSETSAVRAHTSGLSCVTS